MGKNISTPLSQMKAALEAALQSRVRSAEEPLVIAISQEQLEKISLLFEKCNSSS